jgi:hypothetical protein
VQNVPKVPLSIVLQINDLTRSKSIFTNDINSLQLNVKKIYQMALFSGCQLRLAGKSELSGHLSPFDIALWLNCSPQPSKSHNFLKIAPCLCFIRIKCHFENVSH